jgi:hypothetical protein
MHGMGAVVQFVIGQFGRAVLLCNAEAAAVAVEVEVVHSHTCNAMQMHAVCMRFAVLLV